MFSTCISCRMYDFPVECSAKIGVRFFFGRGPVVIECVCVCFFFGGGANINTRRTPGVKSRISSTLIFASCVRDPLTALADLVPYNNNDNNNNTITTIYCIPKPWGISSRCTFDCFQLAPGIRWATTVYASQVGDPIKVPVQYYRRRRPLLLLPLPLPTRPGVPYFTFALFASYQALPCTDAPGPRED